MTQEEKQLLLKDLCGRLSYGLICSIYREDDEGFGWRDAECKGYLQNNDSCEFYFEDVIAIDNIERLKPYLRPMSSMTEEDYARRCAFLDDIEGGVEDAIPNYIDWLNAHHFDYRDLISMGLALEAPEDMYI